MKYFLKMDRGSVYTKEQERYVNLNIEVIKPELIQNNNLKLLCEFTMGFQDMKSFKEFLVKRGILSRNNAHFDIVIAYKYKGQIYSLPIPFSPQLKWFSVLSIRNLLISKKNDESFLKSFLDQISFRTHLPDEYYSMKAYLNEHFSKDPIEVIISNLIDGLCKKNGKTNFRDLYDIVVIISGILSEEKKKTSVHDYSSTSLEEHSTDMPRLRIKRAPDDLGYGQYTLF